MKNLQNQIIEFDLLDYSDKDKIYENEMRLWRAVIEKAIEDAYLPETNKRYRLWKQSARKWLQEDNQDFDLICQLAKLDKRKVLSLLG